MRGDKRNQSSILQRERVSRIRSLLTDAATPPIPNPQFCRPKRQRYAHTSPISPTHQPMLPHSKSKSSNFSRYLKIFLLILLPSTQVTKSSILLVTKNAVSVIVSVPTLTCPCSMIVVAACTVSAILRRVIMTGSRRRQNAETVTDFSTSESLAVEEVEGRIPMSCSLERRRDSCFCRNGESGGRAARRCARCLRDFKMISCMSTNLTIESACTYPA